MKERSSCFSVESLAEALFSKADIGCSKPLLVAYSGGCDSQVLLHGLVKLRDSHNLTPIACHANHDLHPDAARWERQCARWCAEMGVDYRSRRLSIDSGSGAGPEAAARAARYEWFESLLQPEQILLTAHHADDQAETLLLNLLRGSGPDGLAAMPLSRPLGKGSLLRPLLGFTRRALRNYTLHHDLQWIEDPSNEAINPDRNYLRHRVLPSLNERWPEVVLSMSRSVDHAATSVSLLQDLAEIDLVPCLDSTSQSLFSVAPSLKLACLRQLPQRRQCNLLRYWIRNSSSDHRPPPMPRLQEALRQFIGREPCAGGVVAWDGLELRCYKDRLYLLRALADLATRAALCEAGQPQYLSGLGLVLGWRPAKTGGIAGEFLRNGKLALMPRHGGERCRLPGRRGSFSLKNLYREAEVPSWERKMLPLLIIDGEVAWVHGVGACGPFAAGPGEDSLEPFFFNREVLSAGEMP